MSKFMKEFKEFIARGNVMDMAVGIIIGGAFTSIVNSLVSDIIQPIITLIAGGGDESIKALEWNGITYGNFISAVINFLIVAFIVFCMVKAMNKMHEAADKVAGKKDEPAPEPEPAPVCPHCLEEVKKGATRCPHCGGEI